jgi:hypothetical protein
MSQLQRTAAGKIADAQNALLQDEKAKSLVGSSTVRQQEKEKFEKMVLELSSAAPPFAVKAIRFLAPLISWTLVVLEILVPVLYQLSRIISAFVAILPLDVMYIIGGFLICFFGGSYPTTIAGETPLNTPTPPTPHRAVFGSSSCNRNHPSLFVPAYRAIASFWFADHLDSLFVCGIFLPMLDPSPVFPAAPFLPLHTLSPPAFEAWRQAGGKEALMHLTDLVNEAKAVVRASNEDDKRDDDGDGVADVNQISTKELVMRKMNLAVTAMDPNKVNGAMQGIYSGWIGVVAVLKVKFAKTIALGECVRV